MSTLCVVCVDTSRNICTSRCNISPILLVLIGTVPFVEGMKLLVFLLYHASAICFLFLLACMHESAHGGARLVFAAAAAAGASVSLAPSPPTPLRIDMRRKGPPVPQVSSVLHLATLKGAIP
ncbi:unnamed protein product [Ostreobium quekettii]|uniref:Uncharacterized protein n=1 Tax=Ostreobium quekettii TaxID=121088 RepID=A0A8S1IT19_9CHLO|nr:unnamed protein product [Ostreobium quekettii]